MKLVLQNLRLPLASFDLRVDATIERPVTAIFGPSGAGKTSLMEIIAGLRRRHEGRVIFNNRILADASQGIFVPPERRAIGYVPQDGALFPHLNVRANLLYGYRGPQPGAPSSALTLEHVSEVLEITTVLSRSVGDLSGGEKQRVALGRALLAAPTLLLLDEPLAGIDAPLRGRLIPYLARIRDEFKVPMIYISHSPNEVMTLCDEVLVLSRGELTEQAPPGDVFVQSPEPQYIQAPRRAPVS